MRAALLLRDATREVCVNGLDLQMRAGSATGLVVVGDLSGSLASTEHRLIGETPNLCCPTASTRRTWRNYHRYRDQTAHRPFVQSTGTASAGLKGFEAPVLSWTVLGAARRELVRALRSGETPLIGRDGRTANCWQPALYSKPKLGAAGWSSFPVRPGSEIAARFGRGAADQGRGWSRTARVPASPHHTSTAVYPIAAYWNARREFCSH